LKNQNLAALHNFRSLKLKIKRCWGQRMLCCKHKCKVQKLGRWGLRAKPQAAGGKRVCRKSVIGKAIWRKVPEASLALGDFSIF